MHSVCDAKAARYEWVQTFGPPDNQIASPSPVLAEPNPFREKDNSRICLQFVVDLPSETRLQREHLRPSHDDSLAGGGATAQ